MAKHAGIEETYIAARGAVKRGRGATPKHAAKGRHATAPTGFKLTLMELGVIRSHHGWTLESVHHAARIGAL